jgi:hypothetical protein
VRANLLFKVYVYCWSSIAYADFANTEHDIANTKTEVAFNAAMLTTNPSSICTNNPATLALAFEFQMQDGSAGPSWLSIDTATAKFKINTANASDAGVFNVQVRMWDKRNPSIKSNFAKWKITIIGCTVTGISISSG